VQGDLGAIDEKYDIAVSTACLSLDHIVVDTINTAQWGVEYLKKHGVGVATFIGMDKMQRWESVCTKPFNAYVIYLLCKMARNETRYAITLLLLASSGSFSSIFQSLESR